MTFYKRKKAFTLIELIIVIVVVGLLTGLAVPKFVGISRDAQVANLYRDMDTLSKAIDVYYINEESYPVEDLPLDLPDGPLLDIIKSTGDSGTQLHKVNLKKSGKYHSKLKHGYDDSAGDFFLYSKETDQIFYAKGVLNADGDYVYGYALLGLKNVLLGDIPLFEGKMTEVDKPAQTLTGMIPREDSVSVQLNGEDIPVIYDEDSTYSGIPKNIYASPSVMKTFKVELILNKNVINQIKLTYKNKEYRYHVNVIKTEQKYLDETDLSVYNKVIFVDAIHGNDVTGNGSIEKPFKTFDVAYEYISDNNQEALYLREGTYTVSVKDIQLKRMTIIGEGKGTILHFDRSLRRVTTRHNSSSADSMYDLSELSLCRLVLKTTIPIAANIFGAFYTTFHNVAFDIQTKPNAGMMWGRNITIANCVDLQNGKNMIYSYGDASIMNSYGLFSKGKYSKDFEPVTSIITDTLNLDEDYRMLDEGWEHAGTGTNRDGTQAHIGLYGGQYPWLD